MIFFRGALASRLSSQKIASSTEAQILDEAVCISLYTNAFGEGMNPFLLSPSTDG